MKLVFSNIKNNWQSGITVALVSIPLSVSLSLAAGATPQMGIITAVWAGLFAAIFGGSHFNVVGPTGALSGILAAYSISNGVGALPLLSIITGVLILLVFALKLHKYIILIPSSVLHGFTLGVAFIIGLGQLNSALGIHPKVKHETFLDNLLETFRSLGKTNFAPLIITVVCVGVLWGLSKLLPKFPAVIIVSFVGILFGWLTSTKRVDLKLSTIESDYGVIPRSIVNFHFGFSKSDFSSGLFFAATTITIVAILETLISGKIADGITKTRFRTRKEVMGLGIANVASGIVGGIPATAALARTSLNVKSHATHRTSALISSVSIGAISILLISYFKYLPLCIVAAILIFVAINMVETEHFEKLYKLSKRSFVLSIFVAVLTVVWEPIAAIAVGTAVALLVFVNELASAQGEVNVNDSEHKLIGRKNIMNLRNVGTDGSTIVYRFAGQLMYINAQAHKAAIEQFGNNILLIVFSLRNLFYMDADGAQTFAEIIDVLHEQGKTVALAGVNEIVLPRLERTQCYHDLIDAGLVFDTTSDALHELKHVNSVEHES